MKRFINISITVVACLVLLGGCVTKEYVQQEYAKMDQRVGTLEAQSGQNSLDISNMKQSNQEQMAEFSSMAEEALERAETAEKVARGTLLHEIVMTEKNIQFGFDQSALSDEAKAAINDFAGQLIEENSGVYIEIQGHTDSMGEARYNLRLGYKRAKHVLRYLHDEFSIPLHRMSAYSYGETKPLAENDSSQNRMENRRVAIVVMK